jgi:hypothetical protein
MDSYARSGSFCGAPFPGSWTGRTLRIHYHEFSDAAERVDALFAAMFDKEENPKGELYVLSADTYDLYSARSFDLLDSATSWYRSMDALSELGGSSQYYDRRREY